ncbi:hypothetical protein TNCV_2239561 [Trichonephila clavipes]|nr:hypothetical protein TNCV_2239561 [Trichonephila clavipes]
MARCKYCNKCDSLIITEDARSRRGLCVKVAVLLRHFCCNEFATTTCKISALYRILSESLSKVSDASMKKAAEETVEMNNSNRDITAAFDGSRQKRGHTSLNGVVSATFF